MNTEKIKDSEMRQALIRKAERLNQGAVQKQNMIRARNRLSGLVIAALVGGIYMYTLHTVKQEKFLDVVPDDLPADPEKK